MSVQYSEYLHGNVSGTYKEIPTASPLDSRVKSRIVPGLMNRGTTAGGHVPENRIYLTMTHKKGMDMVLLSHRRHNRTEAPSFYTHAVVLETDSSFYGDGLIDYFRCNFVTEDNLLAAGAGHAVKTWTLTPESPALHMDISRPAMLAILHGCINRWRVVAPPVRILIPADSDYQGYTEAAISQIYRCFPYAMRRAIGFATFPDLNAALLPEIGIVFAPDLPQNENEYAIRLSGQSQGLTNLLMAEGLPDSFKDFCQSLLKSDQPMAIPNEEYMKRLHLWVEGGEDTAVFSRTSAADYVDLNFHQPNLDLRVYIQRLANNIDKLSPSPEMLSRERLSSLFITKHLKELSEQSVNLADFLNGIKPVYIIGRNMDAVYRQSREALRVFISRFFADMSGYNAYSTLRKHADDIFLLFPPQDSSDLTAQAFVEQTLSPFRDGHKKAIDQQLNQLKLSAIQICESPKSYEERLTQLAELTKGNYPELQKDLCAHISQLASQLITAACSDAPNMLQCAQRLAVYILPALEPKYGGEINTLLGLYQEKQDEIDRVTDLAGYFGFMSRLGADRHAELEQVRHVVHRDDCNLLKYLCAWRSFTGQNSIDSPSRNSVSFGMDRYIQEDIALLSKRDLDFPLVAYMRQSQGVKAMYDDYAMCARTARKYGGTELLWVRDNNQSVAIAVEDILHVLAFAAGMDEAPVRKHGDLLENKIILTFAEAGAFTLRHLPCLLELYGGLTPELLEHLLVKTYDPVRYIGDRQKVYRKIVQLPGGEQILKRLQNNKELNRELRREIKQIISPGTRLSLGRIPLRLILLIVSTVLVIGIIVGGILLLVLNSGRKEVFTTEATIAPTTEAVQSGAISDSGTTRVVPTLPTTERGTETPPTSELSVGLDETPTEQTIVATTVSRTEGTEAVAPQGEQE